MSEKDETTENPTTQPGPTHASEIKVGDIKNTHGNVHVGDKYGLNEEDIKKEIEAHHQKLLGEIRNLLKPGTKVDQNTTAEINDLKQELAGVRGKLANTKKALEDRGKVLAETEKTLASEQLKNAVPEDQLVAAQRKLMTGDSSQAETLFVQVLQDAETRNKAGAEAAFHLGQLEEDRIEYRVAMEYFEKAVQLAPNNGIYLNKAGLMLATLARYDKAIEYYEKALSVYERKNLHYQTKKVQEIIASLKTQ